MTRYPRLQNAIRYLCRTPVAGWLWIQTVRLLTRMVDIPERYVRNLVPIDARLPERIALDGFPMLHNHDYLAWRTYMYHAWEPAVARTIKAHLPADGVFVDVGANVGLHVVPMARRCHKIVAFEPNPVTASILQANVSSLPNVTVIAKACADAPGMMDLHLPPARGDGKRPRNLGLASLAPLASRGLCETVAVEVTTLDTLRLERIDIMKIDVEGFEGPVLLGSRDTIARTRPVIVMEWNEEAMAASPRGPEEVWQIIANLQYDVRRLGHSPIVDSMQELTGWAGDLLLTPR